MEQSTIHTQAEPSSGHKDKTDQEHKDLCSPFCQCSCCAFAYMVPLVPMTEVAMKPSFSDKVFAAYLQQDPTGITLPVWQPPKIADRY